MSLSNLCQTAMNRFLTRKKDRAVDDNGKKTKKWKKGQPEPKVELNLAAALPSTDDFRTSLIMPSLSTRFSMLREQDDPSSKLGKASDDSVLHPKRQSRLHEFGFVKGGLADIAEVSSIHSAPRKPFANERQNSFDSHTTEDGSGSVMQRSRPGEGNVLFGGRQKVYKIPNSASSRSLGRALYDDDVSMSTFQKFRLQEKEARAMEIQDLENSQTSDQGLQSEPPSPRDLAHSPSLSGYNQRRETSSSTHSGTANTRSSTAATSIASQGTGSIPASSPAVANSASATSPTTELNRTTTKARRLYDQGLDQHINDQQSSTMNRLNSIQRNIGPTGRSTPPLMLSQTRSGANLNDRYNRNLALRTDSPTQMTNPMHMNGKDTLSPSSPGLYTPQSPQLLSPLGSDNDEAQTLSSALQPNDRGKATALGAFNKPKMAFNEQQYAERLKRLHQEQEAPAPKPEKPHKPSLRERAEIEQRKRAEAAAIEQSQQNATEEKPAPSPFSVFQSAVNQMKSAVVGPLSPPTPAEQPRRNLESPEPAGVTFLSSAADSDEEDDAPKDRNIRPTDLDQRLKNIPLASQPTNRQAPPILEHPALRSRSNSRPELALQQSQPHVPSSEVVSQQAEVSSEVRDPDVDSPTLGPDNGGLSGLVRQHLRNVSTVSSDYGEVTNSLPPPPVPLSVRTQQPWAGQQRFPLSGTDTTAHSSYSHSNPWDLESLESRRAGESDSLTSHSPADGHKAKTWATNMSSTSQTPQSRDLSGSRDDGQPGSGMKKNHHRGASTETQDEREAFQRELAQRQRAIQESLRNKVSGEISRSASPAPSVAPSASGLKSALTMLRSKSSRDSFATNDMPKPQEHSSKAMRMLGIGAGSANASTTSLSGSSVLHNDSPWKPEESRAAPLRSKPSRILGQSEQDARRELGQRLQRTTTDESSRDARSGKGRSPPASSGSSLRDRSDSELSNGRSHSRPGRYRDDLEKAMVEGTGSSGSAIPPPSYSPPSIPGFVANPTPPITDTPSEANEQGRLRSRTNSKTKGMGYFEQKTHLQIHTGHGASNGNTNHLSPALSPQPSFSPGLPASPRPSPGAASPSLNAFRPQPSPVPPFSANATPPISASSTPVTASFNSSATSLTKSGTRKKSIAKSDISEPMFVSATSVMDTVDLPPGASLKNGMDAPPPLPPLNPMRRRFGFGRSDHHDTAIQPPQPPFAEPPRTNSSEDLHKPPQARQRLRKTSSEGKSLHAKAQPPSATGPALPMGAFVGRNNSPPRPKRPTEGAMF